MSKEFKKAVMLVLMLLLFQSVYALDYYADVNIKVDSKGFVTIEGSTNHPGLQVSDSQEYTSKDRSYWLLNVTKYETFSDFVYAVNLPSFASINYVRSSGLFRIEQDGNNLVIHGFGQNKPFSVIVQYSIQKTDGNNSNKFILLLFSFISIIILSVVIFLMRSKKNKKEENAEELNSSKDNKENEKEDSYSLKGLTARQKRIMMLLIDEKKPLTQAKIQKNISLPKASVSRNIRSLELKGLVEIEKAGVSNIIRLKR